jgi:hypothetical protein
VTDDRLDERLRDALDGLEPSPTSARRAREAAAAAAVARRRRHRVRTVASVALAGAVLGGGVGAAAVVLRDEGGPAVPAGPEARAAISESAVLARAPWLVQPNGAPHLSTVRLLPSLRFPAGTTYRAAVLRLVRSVAARGTLPKGAALGPPLPRQAVWSAGKDRPARLSLTAPFGYAVPEGRISAPSYGISGSATPEEAERIAKARSEGRRLGDSLARLITVDVPRLRACQRLPRRAPCALLPPERTS